jgi:hypothetical protein
LPDGQYFQYKLTLDNSSGPPDRTPGASEVWVTFETAEPCDPVEPWEPRTQGYWRRQCKDRPHEDICAYVESVQALAELFQAFDCDSICGLMRADPPENDMCRKARRQFMALLLNVASGKLAICNCLDDGREVWDVIAQVDSILLGSPDHAGCVTAKTLADDINNGKGIVSCDSSSESVLARPIHIGSLHCAPNPFTDRATISYALAEARPVRLTIHDRMGRQVRVLLEDEACPGSGRAEWDGLDDRGLRVPNGIYFSRFEAADFTVTGKLIMLR